MINMKLRLEIYKSNVYQYEIAERMGISRVKLCRMLQTEIPKSKEQEIFNTLRQLEEEKAES